MAGKRMIHAAQKRIMAEQKAAYDEAVRAHAGRAGPNFATGLASEGYVGGYMDALSDALLAMNGVRPNRRGWWSPT